MSLWPVNYNRLYDYRCPADLTSVLEASAALAAALPPPCVPVLARGCDTCASTAFQRASVSTGTPANALSARNSLKMLSTILSAQQGQASGRPCTPVGPSVAEQIRARRRPVEFVPSMTMVRT
jgi:hypothetical protein